ncbi:Fc.00g085130.m01.CDS01 [Cosmosporella sp. VM-42]
MAGNDGDKTPKVEEGEVKDVVNEADGEELRFSPEEEAALLEESNTSKAEANALFTAKQYQDALDTYEIALASCPKYLHYPRAVLQSNIAACHLQQEQWKDAIKAATDALDGLAKIEREDPRLNGGEKETKDGEKADEKNDDEDVEEEIISSGAARSAPAPPPPFDETLETLKANIHRIRLKSLLRRARARSSAGGWQNLTGAEEDYKTLSTMPGLTAADTRTVRTQLREVPPRAKAAQEKEMGEMWGKLKDLGNGILKPFGLSTNNFQMVKDEKTGGYSMNFNQGGSSS